MRRIRRNKKGFTLIEVMLAIAIICLICGLFAELIIATHNSYYRVYNSNDATDYAQLYSQAIENSVLKTCEVSPASTYTFSIVPESGGTCPYRLVRATGSGAAQDLFSGQLVQMKNGNGVEKWQIYIGNISYNDITGLFSYTLYMVDNYKSPGTLVLKYDATFWIPQAISTHSGGRTISISPVGSATTIGSGPSAFTAYTGGFTVEVATT